MGTQGRNRLFLLWTPPPPTSPNVYHSFPAQTSAVRFLVCETQGGQRASTSPPPTPYPSSIVKICVLGPTVHLSNLGLRPWSFKCCFGILFVSLVLPFLLYCARARALTLKLKPSLHSSFSLLLVGLVGVVATRLACPWDRAAAVPHPSFLTVIKMQFQTFCL